MDFLSGIDRGMYYNLWLRQTPALQPLMLCLAVLGSVPVLVLAVVAAVGVLLALRRYRAAGFLLAAVLAGGAAAVAVQNLVGRPPPEPTLEWLSLKEAPAGFPGGSGLLAATVYLTLALLSAPLVPARPARVALIVLGALLAFLAGVGRLYLGLHFLSDMLAGWLGGLVWALACREVAGRRLDRERRAEPGPAGGP